MPELPEVETIRKGLLGKTKGKKIKAVEIRVPKLFIGDKKDVIGAKISDVGRVGKILQIVLNNDYSILIHLKMTGQLVYQPKKTSNRRPINFKGGHPQKAYDQPLPHQYTHIIYTFSNGSHLYFNDLRKFGWNKVVETKEAEKELGPEKFGPEPGAKDFTIDYLKKILSRSKKPIKQLIMDQDKISGVGNIYSSEGLFYARIAPQRPANSLRDREIKKLKQGLEKAINLGIKYGGSSENTYVDISGKKGKYMDIAAVYQRKGAKCRRCGGKIRSQKIGGRTAFWCPKCQK